MTKTPEYERGPTHGQHTSRFYWMLGIALVTLGLLGGGLLRPDDWSHARSMFTGALIGLLSGYCVFAWHWLVEPIQEQ